MPETRAPCSLRAAPLLGLGIKTLPGVSIACELIGLGLEPWGEHTEAEASSLLQDKLGPSRRVRRSLRLSLVRSVRPFSVFILVNPISGDIGRSSRHILDIECGLLAIYWPGQSAQGGKGG